MKKAIVIGCPGSGKTTFAESLSAVTKLPLYYLDAVWHKPDRTHIERSEFDEKLAGVMQLDAWILDGNYARTLEARLQCCDTVFLFDLPTGVCLQGATARLGKGRYDMPWIDTELSPQIKQEIESFPQTVLPKIYELLERYKDGKTVIVFKSREQADAYLLKKQKSNICSQTDDEAY